MLAVLSQADATFLAAFVVGVPAIIAAVSSYRNGKQLKPNGGSSARDSLDRLERKVDGLHARHDELASRMTAVEDYITDPPAHGHMKRKDIA